jgi:dihydroanticapsin dehydrogenase
MNTAYVTSKGAVLMLTKNAAAEYAEHNIRVNAICPGAVDTPMNEAFFELHGNREEGEKWMASYQPMGGLIPPQQIAYAAVYLGSDESTHMTGASILIDGGLMAHWGHV